MNTMIATAAAGLSWLLVEQVVKGKPSLLGAASGVVAGLVAVTPASGYAGTMGSVILGLMVSPICFFFVTTVKSKFGYDDSLDVFGVHCIGGITGAIMTGVLDNPAFGGQGIADYTTKPGTMVAGTYAMGAQVLIQAEAVILTLLWSGIGSFILYMVIDKTWGMRAHAGTGVGRPRHRRSRRARLPLLKSFLLRRPWAGEATRRLFFAWPQALARCVRITRISSGARSRLRTLTGPSIGSLLIGG